ncbi:sensor histidine kinase [Mucilaginibacter agri]|uniref:histidine kinase n=1 Tax=Mucilaginibacter agri TaxID=2695265 RepID=A0A965ZM35_9SPHI|nr:sensor histidine kinase [Mucilaginibacter agri]NCD72122.1 hypothetical protein [Mucilaginibacter agri]
MMKFLLACLILLIVCLEAPAQTAKEIPIRVIFTRIQQSKPDTNRVRLLIQAGNHFLYKAGGLKPDMEVALSFFDKADDLSHSLNAIKLQNEILQLKGLTFTKMGDFAAARKRLIKLTNYYKAKHDSVKEANTWANFGDFIWVDDKNDAPYKISYYEKARDLFKQTHNREEEITTNKKIAQAHLIQNKIDLAENELQQVLNDYKAIGYKKLHYTYDLLASISRAKADLHKELFYRMEARKSMEASHDMDVADYVYAKLALVYSDLSMYPQSYTWITRAMEILKAKRQFEDYYGDFSLQVYDLITSGKPQLALEAVKKTEKEVPPMNDPQRVDLAEAYGNCYVALKQYAKAERYYLQMMQIYKLTNFNRVFYTTNEQMVLDFVHYNETMGGFYILTKDFPKAGFYFGKILELPKGTVRPVTLSKIHRLQFEVDSASGQFIPAIQHFEAHKDINDSLYNATKSKQIADLQIKYETSQKEQSIKLLQSQSKSQQTELQKLNLERNITFVGVGMLFVMAGLAYYGYRQKQKSNLILQTKQDEINQQNQSLQLLLDEKDRLLNEKDWLLKEVHHRVKNNLQIVMSLLNTQSAYLKNNAAITAIRESQNRVQAISLIHQKLYSTSNVSSIDMAVYIADLVNYLVGCYNTGDRDIRFEQQIEPVRMDVAQAIPAGLILNEAINNAIKYAFPGGKGGRISIVLKYVATDALRLTIADNGVGLPDNFDLKNTNSLGMEMMKVLSKQLGGKFAIKNKREGVIISIDFFTEKILGTVNEAVAYN